jgi:two-component system OmpR family sensor kinase
VDNYLKTSKFKFILLFLPLLVGLILAIAFQFTLMNDPVMRFQALVDLGTLALISGAVLTVIFLGVWTTRRIYDHRLRRSLEDAQHETARARRRFLGRLDHELKNPLMALKTQLCYLLGGFDRQDCSQTINDMRAQLDQLNRLVTDLHRLANLEEQVIERQPVDIGELLNEVLEATQAHPNYAERQVSLTLVPPPWGMPKIPGDRSLLSLACYNILDNALKYTQAGDGIKVHAFEMDNWLVIEVADDGPGIPEKELPFIFEELYRGANTHGQSGSGLGLALVKSIIEIHKGTISARSQPGKGTIFSIRVPVA